jgi:acetyl-CoA carboxylase biotin carboxyl carrier protein
MAKKKTPAVKPVAKTVPKSKATDGMSADRALVRDLADILRATELTEIEVERNGLRVRVARQQAITHQVSTPTYSVSPVNTAPMPHVTAATTALERGQNPGAVKSPMVGTAYAAPSPGSANFVKIGDEIKEGQTLLIIEAMKTMNQIPAPRAGKVVEILIKDGQPVEYGEVLMIIE